MPKPLANALLSAKFTILRARTSGIMWTRCATLGRSDLGISEEDALDEIAAYLKKGGPVEHIIQRTTGKNAYVLKPIMNNEERYVKLQMGEGRNGELLFIISCHSHGWKCPQINE